MAESTETAKLPAWKQAQTWEDYFKTDPGENEKDVRTTNSTGYQLYAVNEYTITSGFTELSGINNDDKISNDMLGDTLNLQLADAAYNFKHAVSRQ